MMMSRHSIGFQIYRMLTESYEFMVMVIIPEQKLLSYKSTMHLFKQLHLLSNIKGEHSYAKQVVFVPVTFSASTSLPTATATATSTSWFWTRISTSVISILWGRTTIALQCIIFSIPRHRFNTIVQNREELFYFDIPPFFYHYLEVEWVWMFIFLDPVPRGNDLTNCSFNMNEKSPWKGWEIVHFQAITCHAANLLLLNSKSFWIFANFSLNDLVIVDLLTKAFLGHYK